MKTEEAPYSGWEVEKVTENDGTAYLYAYSPTGAFVGEEVTYKFYLRAKMTHYLNDGYKLIDPVTEYTLVVVDCKLHHTIKFSQ